MTPLSNRQKADIAQAARVAYDRWPERAAFEALNGEFTATERFEAWRREEQVKACGLRSLRAATQAHYGRLLAHFQALGGRTAEAARTRGRDADNDRRVARYKLDQALRERGLEVGYAAAICRTQFRCSLAEASAKQLWKLVFTVRSRRKPVAATTAAQDDGNPF
jgi:hypothetical protein